jgi:transketolase
MVYSDEVYDRMVIEENIKSYYWFAVTDAIKKTKIASPEDILVVRNGIEEIKDFMTSVTNEAFESISGIRKTIFNIREHENKKMTPFKRELLSSLAVDKLQARELRRRIKEDLKAMTKERTAFFKAQREDREIRKISSKLAKRIFNSVSALWGQREYRLKNQRYFNALESNLNAQRNHLSSLKFQK